MRRTASTGKWAGLVFWGLMETCLAGTPAEAKAPEEVAKPGPQAFPEILLDTTEGKITLQLRPDVAPQTVKNFVDYVEAGFYENTTFHRVIPGFMVQGGGYTPELQKKPTKGPVPLEAKKTMKNLRGTIAMARTADPDSATSQFFINLVDNKSLDAGVRGPGYTVFGKVVEGMGAVDAIASVETGIRSGMRDVPVEPVVIRSARLLEKSAASGD